MLIKAQDIKIGTQLAESDGYLWDVTEIIKETEKTITIKLHSDYSSFKSHWRTGPGVIKTFRKSSLIYGVEPS